MAEIKISISDLEDCITRLNSLKDTWASNNTTPPDTVGGGMTVNEFEDLAQLYKDINTHMVTLVSNTAAFLTNVKESYKESDNKAAAAMRGGN